MLRKMRQEVSRALKGYCVVLWLAGFLSVGQGNLTPQWTVPHCPNGQTQHSQQGHSHCSWHCSGFDIQSGDGRGDTSADGHVSLVWSLGTIPVQHAVIDGQFPPRGPPQPVPETA